MKKIGLMKSKTFVIYTKKDLIKSITKVRDHCYCTGKYRRAAHDICNPRHKTSNRIPVVFITFSVPIKEELNDSNSFIDLSRPHYENLLIINLKFASKSVEGVKKKKMWFSM